jgi:outer membrane receptor protein involved in Fe transport
MDEGIELDAVYQPSKRWTVNENFTYQDATVYESDFFQETGNYVDSYNTDYIVDGQQGPGIGEPNFTGYQPPNGKMRAPGIPQLQANFYVVYSSPMGWAVGAGPQIPERQYANDPETLHIPTEEEWDGYICCGEKAWDIRLNIKNIFNPRVLNPIDVSFADNDTIYVRPPITASVTIRNRLWPIANWGSP